MSTRGPVTDGRWRDTLVTQQSTDYWATPLLPGCPSSVCLSVTRQAQATPARTAGFMVSVPALGRTHTHTGHTATILQLPWTLMLSLCVAFLPLSLHVLQHLLAHTTCQQHVCVCVSAMCRPGEVVVKCKAADVSVHTTRGTWACVCQQLGYDGRQVKCVIIS